MRFFFFRQRKCQLWESFFFNLGELWISFVTQEEDFGSKWWGYRYRYPCSRGDVCWTSAGTWNSWRRRGRIRSWRTKIQRLAIGNPRPAPPDSRGPFRRKWTRPSLCRKTKSCSETTILFFLFYSPYFLDREISSRFNNF